MYISVYHYPRGALPQICDAIIRTLSPFLGRLFKARETWTLNHTPFFLISWVASEKHPISREIGLKTPPFSGGFRENLRPETNGKKKKKLSRENGIAHAAPLYIRVWRGWGWICSFQTDNVILGEHIFQHGYQVTPSPHPSRDPSPTLLSIRAGPSLSRRLRFPASPGA